MKQGHGHTGARDLSEDELRFQIRINLKDEFAAVARANPADPVLKPVLDVLAKYDATLKHQQASFANYIPHFEQEEQPWHFQKLKKLLQATQDVGKGDDVNAGIKAMKALETATAEYIERMRLYLWTKETLQKPGIQQKYATRFTVYANGGQEVYEKEIADALEADLKALIDTGMIVNVDKFDSDPAHNPQAPKKFFN